MTHEERVELVNNLHLFPPQSSEATGKWEVKTPGAIKLYEAQCELYAINDNF